MQAGEPILLICHSFPPVSGIGGRRWAKFAKELARRGHAVHVIRSTKAPGDKDSLWTDDVRHPQIHHAPVPARFPAVMTRWPLTSIGDKLRYRFWLRVLPLRTAGNYYDMACLSRQDVLGTASRLVKAHGIRRVIATGAPFHLLGFAAELKQRHPGLHLTVDLRDEWTWGTHYGLGLLSPARMAHERQMEAEVMAAADTVISPHDGVLDHLRNAYGEAMGKTVRIPHTIDPDDLPPPGNGAPDGIFRMIYAGSLYGTEQSEGYFPALLDAFSNLLATHPEFASKCRLDLYIMGQGTGAFRQQVEERSLGGVIHFHNPVPPKEILARIARADLVPVFLPEDKKDVLVTKLNELFHLHRPVLHIGAAGAVGRTITERRLGASVRVEELAQVLPAIIRGERVIEVDHGADLSDSLLAAVTDRLITEVLV